MKNKALFPYRAAAVAFPILLLIIYIFHEEFIAFFSGLPTCLFYKTFHLYCPACGNTRCVTAFFHGHIFTALRYNISPFVFGFFLLLAYIEIAARGFGKSIRLLPRRLSIYLILIALLCLYYILRNFFPYLTP